MLERIDPWGQRRDDYRNAHLIANIANMMAGKRDKPYAAEDFLLTFKDASQIAEEQSQAQIEAMIKTWVAAANVQHRIDQQKRTS